MRRMKLNRFFCFCFSFSLHSGLVVRSRKASSKWDFLNSSGCSLNCLLSSALTLIHLWTFRRLFFRFSFSASPSRSPSRPSRSCRRLALRSKALKSEEGAWEERQSVELIHSIIERSKIQIPKLFLLRFLLRFRRSLNENWYSLPLRLDRRTGNQQQQQKSSLAVIVWWFAFQGSCKLEFDEIPMRQRQNHCSSFNDGACVNYHFD